MEDKKNIFSFLGQVFALYGVMVLIFIIFNKIFGNYVKNFSSLFSFGDIGFSTFTLVQLLVLAFIIVASQKIFLTDILIKNLPMIFRNIFFFAAVLLVIILFAKIFKWFEITDAKAWIGFIVSFSSCSFVSVLISRLRENMENKKIEQALEKLKNES